MSVIKDVFLGGAEKKAARAQQEGLDRSTEELRRQFDLTRSDFAPEVEAGNTARDQLLSFLGLKGADAERTAIEGFQESPGQAFLRKRAERSLLRNQAATGGLQGGNVLRELNEQAIGIASGQLAERKDRLAGVAGAGSVANANRAGIGTNISGRIAGNQVARGDARASGIMGRANAIRGTLSQVAGAFTGTGGAGAGAGVSGAPIDPRKLTGKGF